MTTSIHSSRLAVLIPIGDLPFLAQATLRNIRETCGVQVDVLFVTSQDCHPRLLEGIEAKNCLQAPFGGKSHGIHLKLLDWAIKEISHPWICVQHADMFWLSGKKWGESIVGQLDPHLIALTLPYNKYTGDYAFKEHKFCMGENNLIRTHDFCGFYNRKALCDLQTTFRDVPINQTSTSDKLISAVKNHDIEWIHRHKSLKPSDKLDGSDLIGLEIACNCPSRISEAQMGTYYNHCWGMLEILNYIRIENNIVFIDKPLLKCTRSLPALSFMSSMLFDKNIMADKIIPWSIVKEHFPPNNINEILLQYKNTHNVLGEYDSGGIRKIVFQDMEIQKKIKIM